MARRPKNWLARGRTPDGPATTRRTLCWYEEHEKFLAFLQRQLIGPFSTDHVPGPSCVMQRLFDALEQLPCVTGRLLEQIKQNAAADLAKLPKPKERTHQY